jgi:hypothetical protein
MAAKKFVGHSRPGYGDIALIRNPGTGREWLGEVLTWTSTGSPKLRDSYNGEVRHFPPDWVVEVELGNHPRPAPEPDDEEEED